MLAVVCAILPLPVAQADEPACENHSLTNWIITEEPTCTEQGKSSAACDRCGRTLSRSVAPLGHDFGARHIWTPATETEEGLAHRLCCRCDAYETMPVPVKNSIGDHSARARLSGDEALAYDALVPLIRQIAAGQRTDTAINISDRADADVVVSFMEPANDFSLDLVMNALQNDLYAEMFWNSIYSNSYAFGDQDGQLTSFTFNFCVDPAFRADDAYTLDSGTVAHITDVKASVQDIVQRYEGSSDAEKLMGYWTEIQALTSYTEEPGDSAENIGPWTLVSVFDGDPTTATTDVGYADAFRYLCDLGGLVSYKMIGNRDGKGRTWNIVNLDGYNYLVDLPGNDSALFLSGAEGTVDGGYVCTDSNGNKVTYQYGDAFRQLWGSDALTLSGWNYADAHACSIQSEAPACTTDGFVTYTCTECDYCYTAVEAAVGHDFCRWYTVTEATADTLGLEQRDCALCGAFETRTVPKADHVHDYIPVVTEPGCNQGGYTTYTCAVCGHDYVADDTEPRGHDYSYNVEITAPTCNDPGYTTYTCVCGDSYTTDETAATGHALGETVYPVEPTCTEAGKASAKCAVCGTTRNWGVSPLGHDFGVWHSCAALAAEETGEECGTCSRCGLFRTRPIAETYIVTEHSARSRLTGDEALAFDALLPLICAIAEGQRTDTVLRIGEGADMDAVVSFREKRVDFDVELLLEALMNDYPFETYWLNYYNSRYDYFIERVNGVEQRLAYIAFHFQVGNPYQADTVYMLDPATIGHAFEARKNAKAIVAKYEGLSDLEKLRGYADELMEMTSYTPDLKHAAEDIRSYKLASALDDDPETTVVCEGYAYAYQYLCRLGGVPCYVTGGKMGDVGHKWNTVPLNGRMYLIDITNSEPDHVGADGTLFLAGGEGSVTEGFTCFNYSGAPSVFSYDRKNLTLWEPEILNLSPYPYAETHECALRIDGAVCTGGSAVYSCAECDYSRTVQLDARGHDWEGNTCTRCGEINGDTGTLAGDVNGDGRVTSDDAVYLLYHTLFGDGLYPVNQSCDYDGSGAVNSDDAVYLLYYTLFGNAMYPLNA